MDNRIYLYLLLFVILNSCVASKSTRSQLKRHVNHINYIGMEFVLIPSGTFMMGADSKMEEAYNFEMPRHKITITDPFYMGRYEVTQFQWEALMGSNPSSFKSPNCPVENVTFEDVQLFIQTINEKEKTKKYRLPTEAEWEYAARAGSNSTYFFGDDEEELEQYAWYEKNSDGRPHPVGQKQPNCWGLYDVLGNINEYVQDRFNENYYAHSPSVNPTGPDSGTVLKRGGSWFGPPKHNRIAFRDGIGPTKSNKRGFRLVLLIEQ